MYKYIIYTVYIYIIYTPIHIDIGSYHLLWASLSTSQYVFFQRGPLPTWEQQTFFLGFRVIGRHES